MHARTMLLALLWTMGCGAAALADAFDGYTRVGQFELPDGDAPYDVLADGRLITVIADAVHAETAPGTRTFRFHGVLPAADMPSFGAAFVRVSPDGQTIAVGNNGGSTFSNFQIGVFDVDTLAGSWYPAAHFQAAWFDNTYLAITAGNFGSPSFVSVLDTTSDPLAPDNRVVIDNIGGASAGVAFDGAGRLYTGNGFSDSGPSGTGAIKAFEARAWMTGLSGGMAVDFEATGTLVVDVLSASPVHFDVEGHLLVGGGDVPPDADAVAIVRHTAVAAALDGQGPADPDDPNAVRYLDPDPGNDFNFFSIEHNDTTGEIYVRDFGATQVYVYAGGTPVPSASGWSLLVLGAALVVAGVAVVGRRPVAGTSGHPGDSA